MKKKLTCTLKLNALERRIVFPKLQSYCKENKIAVVITGIDSSTYVMEGTAGASTIDECAKEMVRMEKLFPDRVTNLKVVIA